MRFPWLTVGLAALLAASAAACSQPEADARSAIEARYEEYNRAYMAKDYEALAEIFDPAFVLNSDGEGPGAMKRDVMLQRMQFMSQRLTISNARTRIVALKPVGDAYEVTAEWTGDSAYVPLQESPDDPARRASTEQDSIDTWKKTPQGWRLVRRVLAADD
jgi:ketosteroid isomerase-like protein